MNEARLEPTEFGKMPVTDGWFTVNVRDAAWVETVGYGHACIFEGEQVWFRQFGLNLAVLAPGEPNGLYHSENAQEDFLVLAGECLLLVEGQERRLRAWDFVHSPAGTEHIFVGAGDRPCVILMTGARMDPQQFVYPRSELALRHGAGVETETTDPGEAYGPDRVDRPGPPDFAGLPWDQPPASTTS
jgi:uncharacterized cupin superfamily protein